MTVLRLFSLHPWTIGDLENRIGMEKDFLTFIISGLKEKGYLSEEGILTKLGQDEIANNEESDYEEYITARIFTIKKTGELLPLICFDEKDIKIGETDSETKRIRFTVGSSAGTEKNKTSKYYSTGYKIKNPIVPSQTAIMKLLNDFKRLRRYDDRNIGKVKSGQIACTYAGDVFIHMKAVLQTNNLKYVIVSDGFVNNNSIVLNYLESEQQLNFLERLYDKADRLLGNEKVERKQTSKKYPEIRNFLDEVQPCKGENNIERDKASKKNMQVVRNLHAAVEWALYYYLMKNPPREHTFSIFKRQNMYENKILAVKAAKKLGFVFGTRPGDGSDALLSMATGYKIKQAWRKDNAVPNLDILLPLCLIQGAEASSSEWLDIVREFPFLFGRVPINAKNKNRNDKKWNNRTINTSDNIGLDESQLKSEGNNFVNADAEQRSKEDDERDKINRVKFNLSMLRRNANATRHNSENVGKIDYIKAQGWYNNVVKLISMLLPDFDKVINVVSDDDNYATRMVNDINGLKEWFTPLELRRFPQGLYNEILNVSPSRDNSSLFYKTEYILSLSKIMENYLKKQVQSLGISSSQGKTKEVAINYLRVRLGTYKFPDYLETVSIRYYNEALEGRSATLGAYVLVWASHIDSEQYTEEMLYEILMLAGRVAQLRAHGNKVSLTVEDSEIFMLRDNVLQMIKTMED